jgi:hypothetical protein
LLAALGFVCGENITNVPVLSGVIVALWVV